MKRLKKLAIILATVLLAGCGSDANTKVEDNKLSVYTSFYPLYDFATKVGGDYVNVINMVPAGMEPHDYEPSAREVAALENADVFIYNGLGMESWTDKVLDTLQNEELIVVEASENIALLEGHDDEGKGIHDEEEEDHDHDHGQFDPHIWLSIKNAKQEMANIKDAFIAADPEHKAVYEANYATYVAEFDALDAKYEEVLGSVTNKNLVVAHEAFSYLCHDYGLTQMAIEGLASDSEPDPARMAEIVEFAKENSVKVIFFEELVSSKVADTIAKEIGATTSVLNPLEGLTKEQLEAGEDYLSIMEQNLTVLKEALE